jgi:hypothetical protein
MSFTLIDQGSENFEFSASVWQWKAAVELLRHYDIVSEAALRQMAYTATGVKVSLEDAQDIARKIRNETLPKMGPGKRMFADLTITDAPDDKTLHRDTDEQWKNYSVTHEWLEEFAEFCERSKGFQVF